MCGAPRLMSRGAHVTDHTDLIRAPGEVNRAVCVWSDSSHVARCSRHRPQADLIRAPGEVNRAVCVE